VGYCVLTDAESLDLFQFDAYGKSAFQDNFFNYFDTLVSYCVEGSNHYACFTPISERIVEFVAQLKRQVLKQYMSPTEIEDYRLFVEMNEREVRRAAVLMEEQLVARRREVQQREDAVRRENREEFARASQFAQPRLAEVAHSTIAASRGYPFGLEQRASQFASPIVSPREQPFNPSMEAIISAKRTLGYPK